MRRPYFRREEGSPAPLSVLVHRQVRFEEVDVIGIVWHGRYPSYFEDARVAFGSRYGVGYEDFMRQGCPAPIKKMHLDYRLPLRFNDHFTVEGILHWSDAARMNFEFIIRNREEAIVTTGYSIQVMLDREGNLLLISPPFIEEFRQRWRAGEIR